MNRLFKAIFRILSSITSSLLRRVDSFNSPSTVAGRRKKKVIIALVVTFFIIASSALLLFQGPRADIPVANNLLVLFLINIDIILLLVVGGLVGRNLVKLYYERPRKGRFGKRFQTKLIISFLTFTLIPSLLLFIVSSGLLTNAIDNWFNETVEKSLKDSLEVAETLYRSSEQGVSIKASKLAQLIKEKRMLTKENSIFLANTVRKALAEYDTERIIVYKDGFIEAARAEIKGISSYIPTSVDDEGIAKLMNGEVITLTQISKGSSRVFSLAPILGTAKENSPLIGAVLMTDSLDRSVVEKINAITKTFDEYKQLKLQKEPIKAVYEVTLLLVTLLVLFAALWYGFYLSKEITVPIHELADATEKVTSGDLSVRVEEKSSDEIGLLIHSFNKMAEEIGSSRTNLESSHKELVEVNLELDRRRQYIETVFAKIVTGVISIDNRGRITMFNPAARSILKVSEKELIGKYYEDVFDPIHLDPIRSLMRDMSRDENESIEKQVEVVIDDTRLTMLVHITTLKEADGRFLGLAVVFEDLTVMLNAQKTSAWRDIAQHMAHEIKNPLTPIQLNTQRLMRHFKHDKETFDGIFEDSTKMIIEEVEVIRTLVEEFRKFAQLPVPKPSMTPLHDVIKSVVDMYKEIKKGVVVKSEFDYSIGLVRIDAEQMHRVFRNLIENAVDALGESGEVLIKTSKDADAKEVLIEIIDDGRGIDPKNIDKVFLPYFSTKTKGTGLGLAIANRIVADHEGRIRVKNRSPRGTVMSIQLPA